MQGYGTLRFDMVTHAMPSNGSIPAPAKKALSVDAPDISGWLTRQEVCDLLTTSIQTIKSWEKRGLLHPRIRVGRRGRGHSQMVYDPHEIARLPMSVKRRAFDNPGEIAARAFDGFERGDSRRELVIKLRKTPEEIDRLYEEWLTMGGADVTLNEHVRTELERFLGGSIATCADLIERVKERLGATIEAEVPDDATDADIEAGILAVLDQSSSASGVLGAERASREDDPQ